MYIQSYEPTKVDMETANSPTTQSMCASTLISPVVKKLAGRLQEAQL